MGDIKVFISRFSVEIVGGIENYNNTTEEALHIRCAGTEYYCSFSVCIEKSQ